MQPFPAYAAADTDLDRSTGPPEVTEFPSASFPARETTRLSNGLDAILARRDAVPVVDFTLLVDAGYAADQFALPGTARMTMDMLDEGTTSRTDVVRNPSFPEDEFDRRRRQQLAAIAREKVQPMGMAMRVFPRLLYGEGHAYSQPLTGSGSEATLGGGFTARINMNLREDKGWSYGAQSLLWDAAGQRPFIILAPVQTDRTAESMAEIDKEIGSIRSGGDRPPTAEELARVKDQRTLTLPGAGEGR